MSSDGRPFLMPFLALLLIAVQSAPGWVQAPVPAEVATGEVRSVAVDRDGALWLGVRDRGLTRFDGSQVHWVSPADGLVPSGIADILVDRAGRIWTAGPGGYSVFREERWSGEAATGSLTPRVIFSLSEDPRTGAIWMSGNAGAARLLDGVWTAFDATAGLPHPVVHATHTDASGAIWFASRTGLARLAAGEVEVLYPTLNFRSILESGDGTLWFGTSDGVLSWDGRSWTQDLRGRTVYPRLVAADGSIWAGSASAGAFRYDRGEWAAVALPTAFDGAEVFDAAQGADGSIWLATAKGVLRLRVVDGTALPHN